MKKILLASTVLVATAGFASADVTMGGWAYFGVSHNSAAATQNTINHGVRLDFTATTTTDSGIDLTAYGRATGAATSAATWDYFRVSAATNGVSIRIGSTHGAMRTLARNAAFYGYNDGGTFSVDNSRGTANELIDSVHDTVLLQYTMGGFTVAAAADASTGGTAQELAVRYAANGFTVGIGGNDTNEWMAAVSYTSGDLTVGLGAADGVAANKATTATVSYALSAATTLGLAVSDVAGTTSYGLNVSHNLGGGATLSGTIGDTGTATVAGLGVKFNF